MEKASLMEGAWSCYRGCHSKRGRMVMLQMWSVKLRENGHVTEVVSLMEREWSCYIGGQFNGRSMVMLQRWSV